MPVLWQRSELSSRSTVRVENCFRGHKVRIILLKLTHFCMKIKLCIFNFKNPFGGDELYWVTISRVVLRPKIKMIILNAVGSV